MLNSSCTKNSASVGEKLQNNENSAELFDSSTLVNPKIAEAQKIIEKNPTLPAGYNTLALAYIRLARETGDFSLNSKAETFVNHALEIEPANYDAQKIKASLLLTFHKFQEALDFGTQLQKDHPQDAVIYGVLTDANVELGKYQEAADAVQQMVNLRPNMESYARASYVRYFYGDSDGAIDAMRTAAKIADPQDKEAQAWCLVHLGDELFKVGHYEESEKAYDQSLSAFPNYHFGLAAKGKIRAAAGDFENAVKFYLQAQERIPLTLTNIALGDIYTKLGKPEEAQKQYDLAEFIERKFGNIDQRTLALMWADHNTKLDEALQIAAAEHDKRKDIYTADIYAWTLYKKGQFEEAKKIIPEAMRMKTKDARIFYHAGMIEKALGNKKAAADYLQKALKLNPAFDVLQSDVAKNALQEVQ